MISDISIEGSRGATPPTQPNRKSPTLDQGTQMSPEKPVSSGQHSQQRPDTRKPPPQRPQSSSSYSRGRGNSRGRGGFERGGNIQEKLKLLNISIIIHVITENLN